MNYEKLTETLIAVCDRLIAVADAATPGEWKYEADTYHHISVPNMRNPSQEGAPIMCFDDRTYCHQRNPDGQLDNDGNFVTTYRTAGPVLARAMMAVIEDCADGMMKIPAEFQSRITINLAAEQLAPLMTASEVLAVEEASNG